MNDSMYRCECVVSAKIYRVAVDDNQEKKVNFGLTSTNSASTLLNLERRGPTAKAIAI